MPTSREQDASNIEHHEFFRTYVDLIPIIPVEERILDVNVDYYPGSSK